MSQEDRIFISERFTVRVRRTGSRRSRTVRNPDYTLLYTLDGNIDLVVDDLSLPVDSCCLALLDPNKEGTISGARFSDIEISMSAPFLIDSAVRIRLLGSGTVVSFLEGPHCKDSRVDRIMCDLFDEMQAEDAGREELIGALIDQLAIYVLRNYSVLRASSNLELSRVGIIDRRIRRSVELMESHLDRDLKVGELARAAYLSPFHFSRLFKKLMGTSPHAYLGTLRTGRAQTLLADTDLSITDIATRVGYSGSSHFTKAFRDATGLSPRAFRNSVIPRRKS